MLRFSSSRVMRIRKSSHCKQILSDNKEKMEALTEYLLEKESITGDQFRSLMEGKELGEASDTTMFDGFAEEAPEE